MKKFSLKIPIAIISLFPTVLFALQTPTNFSQFVNNFISITNILVPFIVGFGFFGVMFGILKYSGAGGNEEKMKNAKDLIIYGLIGLFVMFSFWGLVNIIARTYLTGF